ncbi:hypothetical protein UY3_00072 [Chelonia mydas]|uniref:Zinc finger and SCAN domain-containing protein 29 n=1 Tax=Chelonia mydas TaxID=8469 RepID=M7CMW1_CHEMY|nr:hypothetical protein UY3_00072 [Chelonia mydas]
MGGTQGKEFGDSFAGFQHPHYKKRSTQQYHVKMKELRQAYQKTREVNSSSVSAPQTCCFNEELHAILSGDPTTTPKRSMDTSQEPQTTSSNNIVDEEEEEEEENVRHTSGGSILPNSQEQFLTVEPIPSQDQLVAELDTCGEYTFPIEL